MSDSSLDLGPMLDASLDLVRTFVRDAAEVPELAERSRAAVAAVELLALDRRSMNERLQQIADVLCRLAALDFDNRVPIQDDGSAIDGIAAYLNMLSEELYVHIEERKRAELLLELRVEERTRQVTSGNQELQNNLVELHSTQRKLIEASRRAGMSDVATSVLHNVGNVLNSLNVSVGMISDTLSSSRTRGLLQLSELLRQEDHEVTAFMSKDPIGTRLALYLTKLAKSVEAERARLVDELRSLQTNAEHIKVIVGLQQAHAYRSIGLVEQTSITGVLEDVVSLVKESIDRHEIELVRDYPDEPIELAVDRHHLIQIVANLVTNACQAVDAGTAAKKRVTLRVRSASGRVQLQVMDNGCGIAPDHLTQVFTYGFTTKKDGHGFGLHGAACTAIEMGGSLTAHSDGVSHGAVFVLDLPLRRE